MSNMKGRLVDVYYDRIVVNQPGKLRPMWEIDLKSLTITNEYFAKDIVMLYKIN